LEIIYEYMKNKFTVIGIVLTTVVLAGIAVFTAMKALNTIPAATAITQIGIDIFFIPSI